MDGNRRWAKSKGLKPSDGHLEGYKRLRELSKYVLKEKNVPFVSAFAFSTENWSRAKDEIGFIMSLVVRAFKEYLNEFHHDNIRVLVLGNREKLEKKVIRAIEAAETKTKNNTGGTLAICLNYGGHLEIVDAVKQILKEKINPDDLTTEDLSKHLYHPEVPAVDLLVRTSGELRTSGFMLWRAAYAELAFVDKYWPEVTTKDIDQTLDDYSRRQRRFGH